MLKIIIGEAKTGKSRKIYTEIMASLQAGRAHESMLIVPEQYTLEAEKELLSLGSLSGFIGLEILSLKRLAHFVFNEVGAPPQTQITSLGQMMLLKEVFESEKAKLNYYRKAFDKKGMLQKCYEFIEELKQNRISPDTVKLASFNLEESPVLKAKIEDLSTLYEKYEVAKQERYFDSADVYEALISKIPESESLKDKHIWIDGFDSFNVQELAIIEALCRCTQSVTLSLTGDVPSSTERFAHTQSVLDRLKRYEGIEIELETLKTAYMPEGIHHLSQFMTTYPVARFPKEVDAVTLFGAQSQISELDWVARTLLEEVRKGAAWRDFAVLTNDLDTYRMVVKRIFERYDIPYFIDEKKGILSNPLIHFLTGVVEAIQTNFRQEYVIKLLKTGFWPFDMNDIASFEHYILEHGIYGERLFKPFEAVISAFDVKEDGLDDHLENGIATKDEAMSARERQLEREHANLMRIEHVRQAFTAPLEAFKDTIAQCHTVSDKLRVLFTLMETMTLPQLIEKAVLRFTEAGDFDNAQLFAQIWNAVLDVFDQLATLIGDKEMTLEALWERLEVGFEHCEVGLLPLTEQHVFIGSLDRSRTHELKKLFIVGINDGILPEGGSDQKLIQEHEKQCIEALGDRWFSNQQMFIQKENFNIYQAITRPTDHLYLSYAMSDKKGSAMRPSYLVGKCQQILPSLKLETEGFGVFKGEAHVATPRGTRVTLAEQMRLHLDGQTIDEIWFDVMAWYKDQQPEIAEAMLKAAVHHHHVERLDREMVQTLYELPLKSSVSALEQFVACPFKYFIDQGIKPQRLKPYEIQYPDVGILFHKTLERFGKIVYDEALEWSALSKEECDKIVDMVVDRLVSAEIYQSKFQYKALVRKLTRVAKRAIWMLTQHLQQGDFQPRAFELAFSDGPFGVPPILIQLSEGERLMIRGVVDRIDILDVEGMQYLKIIDYKSGSKALKLEEIYHGLQMQLCVYMFACLINPSYFKADVVHPGGLYYYKIDDPLIDTTEEGFAEIEAAIATMLKLDGITLDDERVLSALDVGFVEREASSIVQVKRKKDGTYTKDSKVLSEAHFHSLIEHVTDKIKTIGDEIVSGDIAISPCRMTHGLSCNYCDFGGICQFDPKRDAMYVRKLEKLSEDEICMRLEMKTNSNGDLKRGVE